MNLIELSNNLKDVPDQLLLKEVQEPTGAYPAYLVITEMTRRKRMRDAAMKQAPDTTVAEDVTQPTREQMMRAVAQMHQRQAQPMSQPGMPPQSLNAGIMAAAQPNELAAMDASAAPQPAMAGGGLVAFGNGGEIKHFYKGGTSLMDQQVADEWGLNPVELTANEQAAADQSAINAQKQAAARRELARLKAENLYGRPDMETQAKMDQLERDIKGAPSVVPVEKTLNAAKLKNSSNALDNFLGNMNTKGNVSGSSGFGGAGGGGGGGKAAGNAQSLNVAPVPAAPSEEQKQLGELTKGILAFKDLNPEQLAAAQAQGEAAYEKKNPFRLGFLEDAMKERENEIKGAKDTAFNNMLMQAGAGIMKSKSPSFLGALGEGSEAGLAAYQQGTKDLRASKDALLQSKIAYANAQSLYDQGKNAAGDRERDRAMAMNDRGLSLANSKFAAYKGIQDNRRAEETLAMEKHMLPYKEKYFGALANQANYRGSGAAANKLSDADQKAAEDSARMSALMQGHKLGSPEYINAFNQLYMQEIQRRGAGLNYQPGTVNPGALPQGWSLQVK